MFCVNTVIRGGGNSLLGQSAKVKNYPNPGQIAKEFILAGISLYIYVI